MVSFEFLPDEEAQALVSYVIHLSMAQARLNSIPWQLCSIPARRQTSKKL